MLKADASNAAGGAELFQLVSGKKNLISKYNHYKELKEKFNNEANIVFGNSSQPVPNVESIQIEKKPEDSWT
jgi:hypothetical protein